MTEVRQGLSDSLETLLRNRHSCRAFNGRPVEVDTVKTILEQAQLTASWCNAQPWLVYIASGAALERLRAMLYEASANEPARPDLPFPGEYRGAYLDRRRACGWSLYESVGIARGDREASNLQARENFRMFGAPHVAFVTAPRELGSYGAIDCGAWVSNFMLAASASGVSSIAQAALASYPDIVRRELGIPDGRILVCGVSFGYEEHSHPANAYRMGRASIFESVVWVESSED
ncbi:nitroreductase [Ramlibacter tataouinensis]|uniref:nitroreductase n=1 Tax=Ramlibacter tataouinensis TaxID=94132 RepID=UPI0022F3974A|nr:nitroreductase [Ramlibacter tataouinensis]WBY02772.1 nitroreductase [Ramlibacter tataouinensis]